MRSLFAKIRTVLTLALTLLLLLALPSCGAKMLSQMTVEGLTFTLYGKDRVERIEVTRGEEHIGTYTKKGLSRDVLATLNDDSYGFYLTDFNFDRMPDMRLKVSNNETAVQYACYLWDAERDTYVYHEKLSSLQNMGMVAVEEFITATEYQYTVDPATEDTPEMYIEKNAFVLYRWIDGELTEFHRKELTYYEESDIYCYAVLERNDSGEMEITRESWINAEKFDAEKYPLDAPVQLDP